MSEHKSHNYLNSRASNLMKRLLPQVITGIKLMKNITGLLFAGLLVSGCTISPSPLTLDQLSEKRSTLLQEFTADQEKVTRPISLYEAMARALKYNLDYKVEIFEEALRNSESSLANLEMLPDLVFNAGLSDRDNFSGSRSSALLGSSTVGEQSLVPSTSSDRDLITTDLQFSWDVLDFGLSYVRAQQKADAALIANERKRKIANRIIEDVRTAYWRAVSAERLVTKLSSLEGDIADALTAADESFRNKRTSPMAALTYKRELLDIQREIQNLHSELFTAKRQLGALMNLSPSTSYSLVVPPRATQVRALGVNTDAMVQLALVNRPEIREISYEQRISEKEANSALLQLLPNLRLFGGFNYSSNDFLFDNEWASWGAQTSWNVFDVFRYKANKNSNQTEAELLRQRSLALTMAVVTQVHVSASRYEITKQKLVTMSDYLDVSQRIMNQTDSGYKARKVSYQNYVREKMNSIVAEAQYDIAQAELQNAYANIYASVGQDAHGNINLSTSNVDELAKHLQRHWGMLSRQFLAQK